MCRRWYAYMVEGPVDSVDSYLYSDAGSPSCFSGRRLCAIYATCDPTNPNQPLTISQRLQNYIATGITNGGPQPQPPEKPYVYFFSFRR